MRAATTRRALFGAALAIPLIVAAPAVAERDEEAWSLLLQQASRFHRDGPAVVAIARKAGLDADDYSGMYKACRPGERKDLYLIFGDGKASPYRIASLDGVI